MSRKNSRNKRIAGSVTTVLVSVLLVAGLGAISKGFTNWNVKDWFGIKEKEEDTRVNLAVVNLKNDVRGSQLNKDTIIPYFNTSLVGKDPIFKDVATIEKDVEVTDSDGVATTQKVTEYLVESVFKDNGGVKFGTSNQLGSFTLNMVDTYSFNRVKIVGRNYSALNSQTQIYLCDQSSIIVNGAEAQVFGTNAADTKKEAPTEEKVFKFTDMQKQLSISVLGKRATIFTIEMWTEVEKPSVPNSAK